jgi:MFS family permease
MPTSDSGSSAEAVRPAAPEASPAAPPGPRGVVIVLVAAFGADLAVSIIALAVQFLGLELKASPFLLGLYGAVGASTYAALCLVAGRASDRLGRRIAAVALAVAGLVWLALGLQRSPYLLLVLLPFSSASVAFFWPPVQAWLGDLVPGQRALNAVLGTFNVVWTAGLMLGPVACGYLWQGHHFAPFLAATAVGWTCALGLLAMPAITLPTSARPTLPDEGAADPRADRYLPLAWLANFPTWYAAGAVRALFPKLSQVLGYQEVVTGWLVFAFYGGQLLCFVALRQTTAWHYRRLPLLVGLLAGGAGMLTVSLATGIPLLAGGLAVAGAALGFTYVASLFYSLQAPVSRRGWRTGIHETIVGAGIASGAAVSGLVAAHFGARGPFAATALLFAAVLAVELLWWVCCWPPQQRPS